MPTAVKKREQGTGIALLVAVDEIQMSGVQYNNVFPSWSIWLSDTIDSVRYDTRFHNDVLKVVPDE
jgi:hypothetical protein